MAANIIIIIVASSSRSRLSKHAKPAEWLCCYWAHTRVTVDTYATECMLIHGHTHTHIHSQLSPAAVKEAPQIRTSLGRCAECSWLSAGIFGFRRAVFKMTEILSGFGGTSSSSLTECFGKSVRRTLNGYCPLCQSSWSCRRTFRGSFRRLLCCC